MAAKLNKVHMSKKNRTKLHVALCKLIDVMQELEFKHRTKITRMKKEIITEYSVIYKEEKR